MDVLDTQFLYQFGPFMRVRRWLKGIHPTLGVLHMGWSGWETVVEIDVIKSNYVFMVKEE